MPGSVDRSQGEDIASGDCPHEGGDTLAENERDRGAAGPCITSEAQTSADKILALASQRASVLRGEGQAAEYLQQMSHT